MKRQHEWTPSRIRKETLLPKPEGEIDRSRDPIEDIGLEQRVIRHIADHGDIIVAGRPISCNEVDYRHTGQWMIVPVAKFMLDALAAYGAEREDLENTGDREPDSGDEPSLGSLETFRQCGWTHENGRSPDLEADAADDEPTCGASAAIDQRDGWQPSMAKRIGGDGEDEVNGDDEPEDAASIVRAPDWKPWTFPSSEPLKTTPTKKPLQVYAAADERSPRSRQKVGAAPITRPTLGTFRRL